MKDKFKRVDEEDGWLLFKHLGEVLVKNCTGLFVKILSGPDHLNNT